MSWRNFNNHKEETKAVRNLLKKYGLNAVVGHGRGTAWGWLEINIGEGRQFGEHVAGDIGSHAYCPRCRCLRHIREFILPMVQELTGRRGDYNGKISILTQDGWNRKRGSFPIAHDLDRMLQCIPGLAGIVNRKE